MANQQLVRRGGRRGVLGRGRRASYVSGRVPDRSDSNALRRGLSSLTASGFRVRGKDTDMMRRLLLPWQSRSFSYYDMLGEIKYAAQFYSRMLSPLKLYAAEMDANGDIVETNNEVVKAALARIQDPGGGRTNLLGAYGRLMFLTGECYLFVTVDEDTDEEQWEMLSTDELRPQGNTYIRYKAPSLSAEEYQDPPDDAWEPVEAKEAVAYRLWQRHPRYSMYADATMQGVLDLCEELVLLTQAVRARARSRLAGSGILAIADDFSVAPLEAAPDEDPEEDPFLADLTLAMTSPIVDEGSASAVVPLVVRGPIEAVKDGIKHIQIIDPMQVYPETGLRYECIKRIAIGLDMPPEVLLGLEDSNHWTAWQIDEQTWKGHGMPKAVQLCDDLTQAYLRPYLRESENLADWAKYCIAYDPSEIINHPDRTKDAQQAYRDRVIGKKAYRDASGFDEADAPTEAELAEMIGVATHDSSLAWFGTPKSGLGTVETAPGEITGGDAGTGPNGEPLPPAGSKETPTKSTGADVEKGPAGEGEPGDVAPGVVGSIIGTSIIEARILGALDLAVSRAREAAGNRLKSYAKRDSEMAEKIEGVRAGQIAFVLGKEAIKSLQAPPATQLCLSAQGLIEDALRVFELDGNKEVVSLIVRTVEAHAARTLFAERPAPLPPTFVRRVAVLISKAVNGKS